MDINEPDKRDLEALKVAFGPKLVHVAVGTKSTQVSGCAAGRGQKLAARAFQYKNSCRKHVGRGY